MFITYLLLPFLGLSQKQLYSFFTGNSFNSLQGSGIFILGWTVNGASNLYSNCGIQRLIGGYNAFGRQAEAMILLELPPHYSLQISFNLWKIDTWDNETFFMYVDHILGYSISFSNEGSQVCGLSSDDLQTSVSVNVIHNFPSVIILLTSDLDQIANDESWGFNNFIINYYPCPAGCITCKSTDTRANCIFWVLHESNLLETTMASFTNEGWIINQGYQVLTQCSSVPLFGGFLDSWNNERAYLHADDVQVWTQNFNYQGRKVQDICGWIYDDELFVAEVTFPHSSSTLTLKFTSNLDQDCENESFGIRDFQLYIPCLFGNSQNQACNQNCGNGIVEGTETCDDENIYPFDGCFNCEFSCVEGCYECIEGLCLSCLEEWTFIQENNICIPKVNDEKITIKEECDDLVQFQDCFQGKFICPLNCLKCQFGKCDICKEHFYLIDNKCQLICQDLQFIHENQCDDQNLQAFDSCHQCQKDNSEGCLVMQNQECIYCDIGWKLDFQQGKCFPICGDKQIIGDEECDIEKYDLQNKNFGCNQCSFDCQDECIDCQYGKCFACIYGWIVYKFKCQPKCGDYNIQGNEEFDDSNQIRLDGCQNCKNDCSTQCTYCVKGQCLDCLYGWNLSNNFQCEKECGDNKIALISNEECEDLNFNFDDGCYECKMQCCDYCSACLYGMCYHCEYSFTLINQQCIPICGDGLISVLFEECDDMNSIPYDGCYNCNYQCQENCSKCQYGICLDKCEYGYYEIDNICQTQCGDGVLAGKEDCENIDKCEYGYYEIDNICQTQCGDGVLAGKEDCENIGHLIIEGCKNCKYECPTHCKKCDEGICKSCDQGYDLSNFQNQCQTSCGNGMVSDVEECDDGNNNNGDGCSKTCEVEINFVCKTSTFSFSECTYEQYPEFQVTYIKQDYEKQYVLLHFTQQVKSLSINNYFSSSIFFGLIELDSNKYNATLIIIQDVENDVTDVQYVIEIVINQTITQPPHLEIILPEYLYNNNNARLKNLKQIVKLRPCKYLDDQKQQSAEAIKNMNKYIMSSLGGASFLFLILGNSLIFQSIIEVLQQQSYLRFINVIFPLNLFIYFESSNLISIQPLLDLFAFNSVSNEIIELKYVESYEKLKFYEINADLITNIQGQLLLLILLISVYCMAIILLYFLQKLKEVHFSYIGEHFTKFVLQVKEICYKFIKETENQGLVTFGITNCWDFLFMSFLQIKLKAYSVDFRFILSLFFAYTIIYILIYIVSGYFSRQPSCWKININNSRLKLFEMFTLFKKFFFIAILVLFQQNQQIQSILLTLICNIYIIVTFRFNPYKCQSDYNNFKLNELSVCFFTFSTALYWDISGKDFTYDYQMNLGWFHIAMLLSVLFINLMSQVIKMLRWMKTTITKSFFKKTRINKIQEINIKPIKNIMEFRF